MIAAEAVSVRAGGRWILRRVSAMLRPGRVTALMGPNGAGKSTLLGLLAGDAEPQDGAVTLDGRTLAAWRPAALARRRAVLRQDSSLDFAFTVAEVIALGRLPFAGTEAERRDDSAVRAAGRLLGVETLSTRLYPTLSGGERQRVQFARVVAQLWRPPGDAEPRYLLLDEPTAPFDLRHRRDALAVVRLLAGQGIGVLAVLHDPGLAAELADEAVLLKDGQVLAAGPAASVLTEPSLEACFGLPVERVVRKDGRMAILA